MRKKPTPKMEKVRDFNSRLRENPEAKFCEELNWRIRTLLDESSLPKAAVFLEAMQSVLSAFECGLKHEEVSAGYPKKAWREETVEIPRAWLGLLVEGWSTYKEAPAGTTIGEVLELEGGGQGKAQARKKLNRLNERIRLSNFVVVEYLLEREETGTGSWERAIELVAEHQKKSIDTVKRAHGSLGKVTTDRLERIGMIQMGGKTS